jgi:hypothetical protein
MKNWKRNEAIRKLDSEMKRKNLSVCFTKTSKTDPVSLRSEKKIKAKPAHFGDTHSSKNNALAQRATVLLKG